jgi:hypothetical protein
LCAAVLDQARRHGKIFVTTAPQRDGDLDPAGEEAMSVLAVAPGLH